MCSITGIGERLHKVLGQIGSKLWFQWQQKPPLTYNGENNVSTFSRLIVIWYFLYLQVTRTCIKSRTSSNFCQIELLTTELYALSVPIAFEWGKWCLHLFSVTMNSDFIKLTGNEDRHKISDRFEFWSYLTGHFGVTCPSAVNDVSSFSQSPLIGSLSNLQVMRTGIKAQTSSNLGRIGLFTLELFALEHRFSFLIPGAIYMY